MASEAVKYGKRTGQRRMTKTGLLRRAAVSELSSLYQLTGDSSKRKQLQQCFLCIRSNLEISEYAVNC